MVLAPGSSMHGVVSSPTGASLNIPDGAIVTITGNSITIQFSTPSITTVGGSTASFAALSIPTLPGQYTLIDALTVSPDGYKLQVPADVTIPYDKTKIPATMTKADLKVIAVDPDTVQWTSIPVQDVTDNDITINTDILSTYAVVVQSAYPVISAVIGNVLDPESVSNSIENALNSILPGANVTVNTDKTAGILNIAIDGTSYPVAATGLGTATAGQQPVLNALNSGLAAQFVLTDGTAINVVPMPADPKGLEDLFTTAGWTIKFYPDDGMIIVHDASGNGYAGMFGWTAGAAGTKTIDKFETVNGIVQIVYTDGSTQTLAPAVASLTKLVDLLNGSNIQFNIDRSTGVINVSNSSSCWLPDYMVTPYTGMPVPVPGTEYNEYYQNKDNYGLYFKGSGDYNGDGLMDTELWTELGKQIIQQKSCN